MKNVFVVLYAILIASITTVLRADDFWLGRSYSVSLRFYPADTPNTSPPYPKQLIPPSIPVDRIRGGVGGEIKVHFVILANGRVSSVSLTGDTKGEIGVIVNRTVNSWRFEPARDLAKNAPIPYKMECVIHLDISEMTFETGRRK